MIVSAIIQRSFGRTRGFTMVEIALCLGIIAFALVAIMGVLPSGITVQKENREETLINQDGILLLEMIRNGARGADDLTNYLESITITSVDPTGRRIPPRTYTNSFGWAEGIDKSVSTGEEIIGLLSTPKLEGPSLSVLTNNTVLGIFRSIAGSAVEKGKVNREFAFRYQARVEIAPFELITNTIPPRLLWGGTNSEGVVAANLLTHLYEVRLTLNWPVFQQGPAWQAGRNRKSFRTLVGGTLKVNETNAYGNKRLYFLEPNTFSATYPN